MKKEERMLSVLPPYYQTSQVMKIILRAQGEELDLLQEALGEVLRANFVSQAGEWALVLWEKFLGLHQLPSDTTEVRRMRIMDWLRWCETSSKAFLETIINQYAKYKTGKIDLINEEYLFQVTFDINDDVNYPMVNKLLNTYKPAHIAYETPIGITTTFRTRQSLQIDLLQGFSWGFWLVSVPLIKWDGGYYWDGAIHWGTDTKENRQRHVLSYGYLLDEGGSNLQTLQTMSFAQGCKWDGRHRWDGEFSWIGSW